MKKTKAIIAGLCILSAANVFANNESYLFNYDSGDTYEVQLTDNTITWTGLAGSDFGRTETDAIKRKKLSNDVEVIQWNELNGTFVTLTFDRTHLTAISSGKSAMDYWLSYGVVSIKPNLSLTEGNTNESSNH